MNPRRGFLALVGGTLFTWPIRGQVRDQKPTLLLPIDPIPAAPSRPLLEAIQVQRKCQMDTFLEIADRLPKPAFLEPDNAARECTIRIAIERHGSIGSAGFPPV